MPRFPQEMSDVQVRRRTSRSCGGRVNHFLHFGNLCSRKAADLGVFVNYRFVLSEIDAEGLVFSDVALDPLDVGAELVQHFIRLGRRPLQLLTLKGAERGDFSLNYEPAQCHGVLLGMASARPPSYDAFRLGAIESQCPQAGDAHSESETVQSQWRVIAKCRSTLKCSVDKLTVRAHTGCNFRLFGKRLPCTSKIVFQGPVPGSRC